MKTSLLWLVCLAALHCDAADVNDIHRPILELRLVSGKVLKNVQIKSYNRDPIMAKWDGGAGSIARAELPDDVLRQLSPIASKLSETASGKDVPKFLTPTRSWGSGRNGNLVGLDSHSIEIYDQNKKETYTIEIAELTVDAKKALAAALKKPSGPLNRVRGQIIEVMPIGLLVHGEREPLPARGNPNIGLGMADYSVYRGPPENRPQQIEGDVFIRNYYDPKSFTGGFVDVDVVVGDPVTINGETLRTAYR